ncbi:MAG: TIGR02266 family protein, partial [Kofleriaceae bacterium]|nr:TIGR02266 family protein [Kofleriaceae bacterium]
MADPNTRQGKRTPVTLKIKFKSETLEQFIERYAVDVSQGGIFIRTKEPLAVGTQMKFEFQLRDASPLIAGEGTVVWTRENDPSRPAIAPGMGVRFDRLADGSQTVLERILSEKAKQAPARAGNEATTKPPMFTDTPTRVAPAPVQEALGVRGKRKREDSEQTPLPKPMPFHSDAEDFDERAFEEATKVRSLEELAAASAGLAGDSTEPESDRAKTTEMPSDAPAAAAAMPPDELAARRQVTKPESAVTEAVTEPAAEEAAPLAKAGGMIDRDSAPGLPEPPEASRPPKVLDTTPSPRAEKRPSVPPEDKSTKLGVEPAKAPRAESAVPRAVAAEPSHPIAPKRPSSAPIVIGILVVVAAAIGAVWWFVLREDVAKKNAPVVENSGSGSAGSAIPQNDIGSGSAVAQSDVGSGSAQADVGSGSAAAPVGPVVDTVIASSVTKGATVEILGTDQKGAAPFTAKLEKDRAYTARVSAPGFQPLEVEIKGGQEKATAKLKAKTHVISVTSEPAGADIFVDGVNTQKITPADVELTAAQAARPRVRITLRRPGYRQVDQVIDAAKFVDGGDNMTAKVDTKLVVQQQVVRPPAGNGAGSATTNGAGSSAGSATPAGSGSGSDSATPAGGTTPSGTTPSGTTPSGTTPSGTTPSAGSAPAGTGGS